MSDLQELIDLIGERYVFTTEHYPIMGKMNIEQRRAFIVDHIAKHMMKSLGRIAAQVEAADHGGKIDQVGLEEAAVKMVINALTLIDVLGFSAVSIRSKVPELMKSKIPK